MATPNDDDSTSSSTKVFLDAQDTKAAKIWDRFADGYAKSPIKDQETYQTKLQITQDRCFSMACKVLELGCGTGGTSIHHAQHSNVSHYLATDISSKMVEIAKTKAQEANISSEKLEFQKASVNELELPKESQNVVLAMSLLHLLPNRRQVIAKVHNWLEPGGYFVTSTICVGDMAAQSLIKSLIFNHVVPAVSWLGIIPQIDTRLTKEILRDDMKQAGFAIEYEWQPNDSPDAAVFMIGKKKTTTTKTNEK